MAINH